MSTEKKINKYEGRSDEDLVSAYHAGDMPAADYIINKYKPMVRARARALYLAGGDHEDLLQEGMLGLFRAIREFDVCRETTFSTYAWLLVTRQMYTAIEAAGRRKHQVLNHSVSISELEDGGDDLQLGHVESPEDIFFFLYYARALLQKIQGMLSPMERQVLRLYLEGMDYHQISTEMGKSLKSVDNALQRIRTKVMTLVPQV